MNAKFMFHDTEDVLPYFTVEPDFDVVNFLISNDNQEPVGITLDEKDVLHLITALQLSYNILQGRKNV